MACVARFPKLCLNLRGSYLSYQNLGLAGGLAAMLSLPPPSRRLVAARRLGLGGGLAMLSPSPPRRRLVAARRLGLGGGLAAMSSPSPPRRRRQIAPRRLHHIALHHVTHTT